MPAAGPVAADMTRAEVRFDAAAHLGREFVVRTAAREVVFDDRHGWIAEPRHLVAAAVAQRLGPVTADLPVVRAMVEAFELDLTEGPRAHVRIAVQHAGGIASIDEWAPAGGRSPADFAAAMSEALDRAAAKVAALATPPAAR